MGTSTRWAVHYNFHWLSILFPEPKYCGCPGSAHEVVRDGASGRTWVTGLSSVALRDESDLAALQV